MTSSPPVVSSVAGGPGSVKAVSLTSSTDLEAAIFQFIMALVCGVRAGAGAGSSVVRYMGDVEMGEG